MSAQSPSLAEILAKLGDDWQTVRNRVIRHPKKRHVDDADVERFGIAVDEGQKCIGASDPSSKTVGDLHDALGKRACEEASQPTDGPEAVLMLRRSLVPSTLPRDGQKHLLGLTLDDAKVWMKQQADGWEQEDENRDEALHKHPFGSVLERVTVWTGISSEKLREATLKHFDGYSDLVGKLLRLDDKGQTRELWERLVNECESVLLEAGLMPQKPTDKPPLAPHPPDHATTNTGMTPTGKTGEGEGNAKKARAGQSRKRTRKVDPKTAKKREERKAQWEKEEAIAAEWNGETWVGGYQGYVDWKNENLPKGWSKLTRRQVERAIENVNRRARYRKK